jgi:hypothetical protein
MAEITNYVQDFLRKNQFVIEGNWEVSMDGKIRFKSKSEKSKKYCVYIWIARKKDQIVPLYIGKARNGVVERMGQHMGGFREDKNGSVSGRRKRKILEKIIESNWEVEVHSRDSQSLDSLQLGSKELFDFIIQENKNIIYPIVSLYSFEEELLIRFFEENFPQITLMNGLNDSEGDPEQFLNKLNAL